MNDRSTETKMNSQGRLNLEDWGKFLLRFGIAGLMLFHGIGKLFSGVGGIIGLVEGAGLPGFVAYGVYIGEIVAPTMMLLGFYTRWAALILGFNMVVAIGLAKSDLILKLNEHGAWAIELQLLFLLGAVVVALLGSGRISVTGKGAT